mgnify:CR=1 FL=1
MNQPMLQRNDMSTFALYEPLLRLADHRAEPAEHHREQHGEPGQHEPRTRGDRVHPQRGAHPSRNNAHEPTSGQ